MAKMTKKEMFTEILGVEAVASNPAFVEFINHEIELLSRKRSSGSRGLTKTQKENQEIKARMVEVLTGEQKRASEIAEILGISQNKATALVTQLVNENIAERITVGKVAMFTVAVAE